MRTATKLAAAVVLTVAVVSLLPDDPEVTGRPVAGSDSASPAPATAGPPATSAGPVAAPSRAVPPTTATQAPAPVRTAAPVAAGGELLLAARGGDGDSWKDTRGREYRLGMVNAPETGECYGSQATAERKRLVAAGFRADVYAQDRFGREVSVVSTADGLNLNVHLAREGFVDDRYLDDFRDENPSLAAQLDRAFAAAKAGRKGLWRACGSAQPQGIAAAPAPARETPPPAAASGDCHPDYATCVPVKGDGSGRGAANDLDCGDIDGAVRLRQAGVDPYRLDADGDGVGCDS